MRRFTFAPALAGSLLLAALLAHPASAQNQIGGGVGYLFDEPDDWKTLQAQVRIPIRDTHWSIVPGFEYYINLSMMQIHANLVYNIETTAHGPLHPYVGVGGGIVRTTFDEGSETTALLTIVAGTTYDLKNSPVQLFFESLYSSGIHYTNTEVLHAGFLVRLGKK